MSVEMQNGKVIGSVSLVGENTENLPMWSINYYIQEFCNNYNKVIIIQRICEILQTKNDSQILLSKKSGELIPVNIQKINKLASTLNIGASIAGAMGTIGVLIGGNILEMFLRSYATTIEKSEYKKNFYILEKNNSLFWDKLLNEPRPLVFVKSANKEGLLPLIDYTNEESIKITKISYNSPLIVDANGLIGGLLDLIYAKDRKKMENEVFIANQVEKYANNIHQIVRASQIAYDEKTPRPYRNFAQNSLQHLMTFQDHLNESLGIRVTKIDYKV